MLMQMGKESVLMTGHGQDQKPLDVIVVVCCSWSRRKISERYKLKEEQRNVTWNAVSCAANFSALTVTSAMNLLEGPASEWK